MPPREKLGRWLVWAGRLVAVVAIGFLVWTARRNWIALSAWEITPQIVVLVATAALVYGGALMLVAESWHRLVSGVSGQALSRYTTWPSFGVTQIAKYLPGNVFHYVGRHFYLLKQGVAHRTSLTAALWEAIALCAAALACASAAWLLFPFDVIGIGRTQLSLIVTIIVAGLVAGATVVLAVRRASPRLRALIPPASALLSAASALLIFFAVQGGAFAWLFQAVGAQPRLSAVAIASLSWLAGYLTPGAPGGIGSREAVMVGLASPMVGSGEALILAALFRVVTTLGDMVCFGISSAVARRGMVLA